MVANKYTSVLINAAAVQLPLIGITESGMAVCRGRGVLCDVRY